MPFEENIRVVKAVMDELMRGNLEPLLGAITEDAQIKAVIPPGTPISGDFRGREGFLRYLTALSEVMEIIEVQTHDITASEGHVVMVGYERARVKRTGKMLECDVATVFALKDGKITKMLALADMSAIVEAYAKEAAV